MLPNNGTPDILVFAYFRKSVVDEYGFGTIPMMILEKLFSWAINGRLKYIRQDDNTYYEINYSKIASYFNMSPSQFKKMMYMLSGNDKSRREDKKQYPLFRNISIKHHSNGKFDSSIYYSFNSNIMDKLIFHEMLGSKVSAKLEAIMSSSDTMIEMDMGSKRDKRIKLQRKMNPNILAILKVLLDKKNGYNFRNIVPYSNCEYTLSLLHFAEKLEAIYDGRFNSRYLTNEIFEASYKHHHIDKAKEEIRKCKGNWIAIKKLVIMAADNYKTWFDELNEPANKKSLPTEISAWIHRPDNCQSIFLACIDGEAFPLREQKAENVYNSIPKNIVTIFQPIYRPKFDGFAFWYRVKQVINWYNKYAIEYSELDSNFGYWIDGGIVRWAKKYVTFLIELCGSPDSIYLKNIGTNNNTWQLFLNKARADHRINIEMSIA